MHFQPRDASGYRYDGMVIKPEPCGDEPVLEPAFFLPFASPNPPHSLESSLPFIDLTGDAIVGGVADAFTYEPPRPAASHSDDRVRLQDAYILNRMLNDGPSETVAATGMESPMAASDLREFQGPRRHLVLAKTKTLKTLTTRMMAVPRPSPATPISALLNADSPVNSPRTPRPLNPCSVHGCHEPVKVSGRCERHKSHRICTFPDCTKNTQTNGRCIRHGGGKRCQVEGCPRGAQARGKCKTHGGGVRCKAPGCFRSSQGSGLCRTHGGGKLCDHPGCKKGTQRHGKCSTHGGARRCRVEGCEKVDRGGGLCGRHKTKSESGKSS